MALPKLLQKLFQNGGAGSKLNESIMPFAYAQSVNGKLPDPSGNIEIPARNVGDEWHSFTGQIPVGGIPYCGQIVTRATYADLWAYVQAQGLVKTESEWQALATSQNGNVPFYSDGDGSTTFRMPKVVGYIKGAASQYGAGSYTAEGLPNITGTLSVYWKGDNPIYKEATNAFSVGSATSSNYAVAYSTTLNNDTVNFRASRSNPIYGNSDHVTPETSVILFGVYAFGEITNVGALDADTLATGLATVEANLEEKEGVISSGATNRARWIRYKSGLQIVWGDFDISSGTATVTMPVAFAGTGWSDFVVAFGDRDSSTPDDPISFPIYVVNSTASFTSYHKYQGGTGQNGTVCYTAIGRWK